MIKYVFVIAEYQSSNVIPMFYQARKQFPETVQAFPEVFDKVSRIGRAKTKIEEKKEK